MFEWLRQKIGTTQMKLDAYDDEMQEHENYIAYHQKEITYHRNMLHHIASKVEELRRKNKEN